MKTKIKFTKSGKLISLSFTLLFTACQALSQGVAINSTGTTSDPSAMLDIKASDKGILIPNISLASTSDVSTISSPSVSLVVYNSNDAISGGNGKGFYWWDGSSWRPMISPLDAGVDGDVLTSKGPGLNPVWKQAGGSSTPITELSPNQGSLSWAGCADTCHNLTESGKTDWRMPTMDEVFYYRTVFDAPSGGWINAYIWLAGPLYADGNRSSLPIFNEYAGTWLSANNYAGYGPYSCRCVR